MLKLLEINGFKSFAKKTVLEFKHNIVCIVGPNGSGKSNIVEAFRFVLGEQSMKSMRGKTGSDFIFKGSKKLPKGSRASVSALFDNKDGAFRLENGSGENTALSYDEVLISRSVYADGLNKYNLNSSEVRLKDIHNTLNSVNVGASSHHIISQGEADRVLNAGTKERKEMIEDALGLRVYQYKIKESERKLKRTEENMREVALARRENAPHLNFLKRQIKKFEEVKAKKIELLGLYKEYFIKEDFIIKKEGGVLESEKVDLESKIRLVKDKINSFTETPQSENHKIKELESKEKESRDVQRLKNELQRKLGRLEGMIEVEESKEGQPEVSDIVLPRSLFDGFFLDLDKRIDDALSSKTLENLKSLLLEVKSFVSNFSEKFKPESGQFDKVKNDERISELRALREEALRELEALKEKQKEIESSVASTKKEINSFMGELREKEREKFEFKMKLQELNSKLSILSMKEESLKGRIKAREEELEEARVLAGYHSVEGGENEDIKEVNKEDQEVLRRKIERIKIRLEDSGAVGEGDVRREFEEVSRREEFLSKELEDLEGSILSLEKLIKELREKIDSEFESGIKKINSKFKEFFVLMFGGGDAGLEVVMESKKRRNKDGETDFELEEDKEAGVEISVSLPEKKVKDLHALSGGERSLTSIALLFAMSFVNPPPFLILDETDAALDEANSRKYGDMLERLAEHSQLVVVTHNRETMSRAGILYGVTIGRDGASKLLSIKFEEALVVAK